MVGDSSSGESEGGDDGVGDLCSFSRPVNRGVGLLSEEDPVCGLDGGTRDLAGGCLEGGGTSDLADVVMEDGCLEGGTRDLSGSCLEGGLAGSCLEGGLAGSCLATPRASGVGGGWPNNKK